MDRGKTDISIRLGVDDKQFVAAMRANEQATQAVLDRLVKDGKAAGKEVEALTQEVNDYRSAIQRVETVQSDAARGTKKLADAFRDAGYSVDDMATRAGPLGELMVGFGPAGIAAAAGIALVAAAFTTLSAATFDAAKDVSAYASEANRAGFTVDQFRAFELQLIRSGQGFDTFTSAAERFQSRIVEASNGQGEMASALKDTHPELLKTLIATEDQADRLLLLARAVAAETNETERARIAKAALDDEGIALLPTLLALSDQGMGGLEEAARAAGVALDQDGVQNLKALNIQAAETSLVIDTNMKNALAGLAPVLHDLTGLVADLAKSFGEVYALANDKFEMLSTEQLERSLGHTEAKISSAAAYLARGGVIGKIALGQLLENRADADRIREILSERTINQLSLPGDVSGIIAATSERDLTPAHASTSQKNTSKTDSAAQIAARARAAASERARLEAEAARLLIQQNDIAGALAIEAERLNVFKSEGLLTEAQHVAALEQARSKLEAQTPAYRAAADAARAQEQAQKEFQRLLDETARQNARDAEARARQADALFERERAQQIELAQIRGDRDALRGFEVEARAGDLMGLGLGGDEAAARAEAEVRALESAEARAAAEDLFRSGVRAAFDGDFEGFVEGVFSSAADTLLDKLASQAADIFGNLMFGDGGGGSGLLSGALSLFGIPAFHVGYQGMGVGPEERLARLHEDEVVLTPAQQMAGMGGGGTYFTINAPGADRQAIGELQGQLRAMAAAMRADRLTRERETIGIVRGHMRKAGPLR